MKGCYEEKTSIRYRQYDEIRQIKQDFLWKKLSQNGQSWENYGNVLLSGSEIS